MQPMRKLSFVLFIFTLLGSTASTAKGQNDDTNIIEKLCAKIAENPATGTNSGNSVFILADPGIAIDPALNPSTSQDDRRAISRVLDRVPGPSLTYEEMSYTVSAIYGDVLQYHEVPVINMTAKQKRDLSNTNKVLFKSGRPEKGDSDKVKAYKKSQATYQDAVNAVQAHRAPDGTVSPQYTEAQQNALQEWNRNGYKDEIESAIANRANLTSLDPDLWFQQMSAAYTAAQESPGTPEQFEPVEVYPAYNSWASLQGWTTITLSKEEIHNLQPAPEINTGGTGQIGTLTIPVGPPKLRDSGSYYVSGHMVFWKSRMDAAVPTPSTTPPNPDIQTHSEAKVSGITTAVDIPESLRSNRSSQFKYDPKTTPTNAAIQTPSKANVSSITMEVLRVNIDRPWLDALIFRSQIWRWSHNAPFESKLISDGTRSSSSIATDILMPYLPTGILVSRNVRIMGNVGATDTALHSEHVSTGASVSWGPFAVSGHYVEDHKGNTFDSTVNESGITIPGYQIIGWYCEILPKSPDPDLVTYRWPVGAR
jgi:hypothetical protein